MVGANRQRLTAATADKRLDGHVAVVTGAGGGIGRSCSIQLASLGAAVVINDVGVTVDGRPTNPERAAEVVEEIRSQGGDAIADTSDVSRVDGGEALVRAAEKAFGRVDILVHSAGILRNGPIDEMTGPKLLDVLGVHLLGAFHVVQPMWSSMSARRHGRIVLISSAAGVFGAPDCANYSAAKMGLVGLAFAIAVEGRAHGINANAIVPMARTRMFTEELDVLPADVRDRMATLHPESVGAVAAWLADPACNVSGEVFSVAGSRACRIVAAVTEGIVATDVRAPLTADVVHHRFDDVRDVSTMRAADGPATGLQLRLP